MKKILCRGIGLLTAMAFTTVIAADSSYHDCTRDGVKRTVELRVDGSNGVPCRILYHRDQEGVASRLMWRAEANPDYCTTKLSGFLSKLKTKHNWLCQARATEPVANPVVVTVSTNNAATVQDNTVAAPAEPALAAALPAVTRVAPPRPKISQQRVTPGTNEDDSGQSELTLEQLRRFFPPGFYTADNQDSASTTNDSCSGDGYFVWNTRDRGQPVFEMGRRFQFYVNLATGNGVGAQILQTGRPGTCPSLLTSIHCGLGQGDILGTLDLPQAGKFSCEKLGLPEFSSEEAGLVLFSERTILNADQCDSDMSAGLMALSTSPLGTADSNYLPSAAIQFIAKTAVNGSQAEGPGTSCRYLFGKTAVPGKG